MTNIQNEVFYIGNISDFVVEFLIRSGEDELFPNLLLNSYGLEDLSDEGAEVLFTIIINTIEYFMKRTLRVEIQESWNQKIYQLRTEENKEVLMEDFEKGQLGVFIYLLYLKRLFNDNKDVCVIISEIAPLIKQVKNLEQDIGTLSKEDYVQKNPTYANDYDELYNLFREQPVSLFRFYLLYAILAQTGPYIQVFRDEGTKGEIKTRISKSFLTLLNRCDAAGSRYTISFVVTRNYGQGHANLVIIDRELKTIERYEPNGYIAVPSLGATGAGIFGDLSEKTDDVLEQLARKKGFSYLPPSYFCPKYGAQQIESHFQNTMGLCVSWSILYGIERVTSGLDRDDLARNFLDILLERHNLYGATVQERAELVESLIMNKIHSIFEQMDDVYVEISQALGVKVKYEQGKLVYFS